MIIVTSDFLSPLASCLSTPPFALAFSGTAFVIAAGKSSFSSSWISLKPHVQFLHALRVFLTSQSGLCTAVARLRSSAVKRELSSIVVGVEVPLVADGDDEVDASVNVQSAAFFAAIAEGSFFRRRGRAAVLAGAVAKT